jgi:hypothetical protein
MENSSIRFLVPVPQSVLTVQLVEKKDAYMDAHRPNPIPDDSFGWPAMCKLLLHKAIMLYANVSDNQKQRRGADQPDTSG